MIQVIDQIEYLDIYSDINKKIQDKRDFTVYNNYPEHPLSIAKDRLNAYIEIAEDCEPYIEPDINPQPEPTFNDITETPNE